MIIHNVRLGFATNSSSTHSLIFLKDVDDDLDGFEFGWDDFTAVSQDAKRVYLAIIINKALREHIDDKMALLVTSQLVTEYSSVWNWPEDEGYIDHQSIYTLPYNWSGNGLNYEFVKEFSDFLLQKNLVILGGNDNESISHPLDKDNKSFILSLERDGRSKNWVAKKDLQGFWTLFNRKNGAKIRLSFPTNNSYLDIHPEYATTPELIDIKITDYCTKGCPYCYQDSNKDGKHAEIKDDILEICYALSEMQVFEVAIGGGEPIEHPDFIKFIKYLRLYGIIPNFSTRSLSWMKDPIKRDAILNNIGTFAYSVDNTYDVNQFASYINIFCNDLERRPSIHCVMGMSSHNFENILDAAFYHNLDVVLLDYKEVGRGFKHTSLNYSDWIDKIIERRRSHKCPNILIDTPLAKKFKKELNNSGVKDLFIQTEEGKFSMYWDLVNSKIGPSSFSSNDEMLLIDINSCQNSLYDQIVTGFRTF